MQTKQKVTNQILNYWFADIDNSSAIDMNNPVVQRWHTKDSTVDDYIRTNFQSAYEKYGNFMDLSDADANTYLAFIILYDQFPHHIFRGSKQMFDTDDLSLSLCLQALEIEHDSSLSLIRRLFMYMPLMHSENIEHQEKMLKLFSALYELSTSKAPLSQDFFHMAYNVYAKGHYDIVNRFGRFPHRNELLGRQSTPEELAFLKQENSAF